MKHGLGLGANYPLMPLGASSEPETIAYLTAVGIANDNTIYYPSTAYEITGKSIWIGVNTFVTTVKTIFGLPLGANNLGTKFPAIYPFIGGSATTHKYNLCNPVDTNAGFRLSFSGGWTHSATGALPNGTNASADTFVSPSTSLSQNSTHIGYYSRSNTAGVVNVEMGVGSGSHLLFLCPRYTTGLSFRAVNSVQSPSGASVSNTAAYFQANRISSTTMVLYRNTTAFITDTISSTGLSASKILLGSYSGGGVWSDRECAFATIGIGMTVSEQTDYYNAIQNLQTTLKRQV